MPINTEAYSRRVIREMFEARRARNPAYSQRAFARALGLDSGTLSAVLQGRRHLPPALVESIAKKLCSRAEDIRRFVESERHLQSLGDLVRSARPAEKVFAIDRARKSLVTSRVHMTLLSLIETRDFRSDIDWIAKRIGAPKTQCRRALDELAAWGFVQLNEEGAWTRVHGAANRLEAPDRSLIYESNKNAMKIAATKIGVVSDDETYFSTLVMAVSCKRVVEAKLLVREFRLKLAGLLEKDQDKDEVYQLNIQLFPLTETKSAASRRRT